MEIGHEIISTAILSLPLIQKGQLSVTGERMCPELLPRRLVPKSETCGFNSWLTSSLRIECNFPLATSDIEMMSETKFYSLGTNEQNK